MFGSFVEFYTAHAGVLFVGFTLLVLVLESARRRWAGVCPDMAAFATTAASGVAFLVAKSVVAKLAATSLAVSVFENFALFELDLLDPWVWVAVFVACDFALRQDLATMERRRRLRVDQHSRTPPPALTPYRRTDVQTPAALSQTPNRHPTKSDIPIQTHSITRVEHPASPHADPAI
ncbi:MAG: hypothetical protein ABJH68_02670 [Ilumatobacter sp.]|uniref:hypothetical protein n=1 Tax=Ilumatobacter sp. TaxID=1967498 RepID=UPI00329A5A0D